MKEIDEILLHYALNYESSNVFAFGNGLINKTWKVILYPDNYTLLVQQINTTVFKNPDQIARNIRMVAEYLRTHNPDYLFIAPIKTLNGQEYFYSQKLGYIRLFKFLDEGTSINVVDHPRQAYEAALQFGLFTRLLAGFDANKLDITIKDFHNLSLRYKQFMGALQVGNRERIQKAHHLILYLKSQYSLVQTFQELIKNPLCSVRVAHHDTKINNILFDNSGKGLCVIDLDTLMPGYFFSDIGDMMRTYLSPVSEEESDFEKIIVREDIYQATLNGYLYSMNSSLSEVEKKHLVYSGKMMIYMQALRFITDYLLSDIYYKPEYPNHNMIRAENQTCLLKEYINKEFVLEEIAKEVINSCQKN